MGCFYSKFKYIFEEVEMTRFNINSIFYPVEDTESEPDIRNFNYYYGDEFDLR
jgi:hypothetical protein